MKYKIFIYGIYNADSTIAEIEFDDPCELNDALEEYEGYPCKIVNLETCKTILKGTFDYDCLDEDYYE